LASFLAEHFNDHNGVWIGPIHYPPRIVSVDDPQFVAPRSDRWHRPRMRQRKTIALLQTPEQDSSLDSAFSGKWRRLDLAM
jgi:hypothetical protein